MSIHNQPLPFEVIRSTVSIEKKLYSKIKTYCYKKNISLAAQIREWITQGYLRDKEKGKMDI